MMIIPTLTLTPLEQLHRVSDLTVGADGTSTATGSVFWYDGTSVEFRRHNPARPRHDDRYLHDSITVYVTTLGEITFERTTANELLTRFPTSAVSRVTIYPHELWCSPDPRSDRMWD